MICTHSGNKAQGFLIPICDLGTRISV